MLRVIPFFAVLMASIKDVVAHIGFFIHRQMYFNRKFLVEGVGWKLECHEDTIETISQTDTGLYGRLISKVVLVIYKVQ